jgi:ABC-type Na+ efflux pump permease subunit
VGGLDRRTAAAVIVAVLAIAGLGGAVATAGTAQDANIYSAGVAGSSAYYQPLADDPRFRVAEVDVADASRNRLVETFERSSLDVLIGADAMVSRDTRKGRAAAAAVREAVSSHNERLMRLEADRGNEVAAFPVSVDLRYVERSSIALDGEGPGDADGTDTEPGDGATTDMPDRGTDGPGSGNSGGIQAPSIGSGALFGSSGGRPSDIQPPFPFASLVLAFAFVVPMNFAIQAYASSVLRERTNRRGELTLIAPVSPATIVAGKTLPYLLGMLAIAGVTALALGGGFLSIAAVTPIALFFLAAAFVAALLARSHKELTFVLVTVSVTVTTYVFVPAVFSDVHPIAAISPLTMVVRDLEGVAVSAPTVAFSTGPMLVAAGVLFYLGGGLYREEDLFAQRPVPEKILDALATPIRGAKSVALLTVLLLPFVFLAELLVVAALFVLPRAASLPALLAAIAVIEEVGKSVHVLAGFERGRFDRGLRTALVVGAASGIGFFLAEKLAVVAQLVGLQRVEEGRVAFQAGAGLGGDGGLSPLVLVGLLLAPLLLHVVTASLSAVGASRGRRAYLAGLLLAALVHVLYNATVVVGLVR